MKRIIELKLGFLINSTLVGTLPGIGSLNSIVLNNVTGKEYELWLYLADWAFVHNGNEIASSDELGIGAKLDLKEYYGLRLTNIYEFPQGDEIHFEFENEFRLEVWENIESYGSENQEFFKVSCQTNNPKHILTYPFKSNKLAS